QIPTGDPSALLVVDITHNQAHFQRWPGHRGPFKRFAGAAPATGFSGSVEDDSRFPHPLMPQPTSVKHLTAMLHLTSRAQVLRDSLDGSFVPGVNHHPVALGPDYRKPSLLIPAAQMGDRMIFSIGQMHQGQPQVQALDKRHALGESILQRLRLEDPVRTGGMETASRAEL